METISFRVDDELKKELNYVKSVLNSTQSQAIKDAIHTLYQFLIEKEESMKSPQAIFKESGYLGSFQGNSDLSVNYKKYFYETLKDKHERI